MHHHVHACMRAFTSFVTAYPNATTEDIVVAAVAKTLLAFCSRQHNILQQHAGYTKQRPRRDGEETLGPDGEALDKLTLTFA